MQQCRPFIKNRDAAALITFAICAPVLFVLVIGFIEVGLVLFVNTAIKSATNVGAHIGKTGYIPGGQSTGDYIRANIAKFSAGLVNPSALTITTLSYGDFDDIGQPEPCLVPPTPPCPGTPGVNFVDINGNGVWDADMGVAGDGGPGAVVLYRVSYPWHLFTPLIRGWIGGKNGIYTINAAAAVKNAP